MLTRGCVDSAAGGFETHITASEVPVHADANLLRAKEWIDTCVRSHDGCARFQIDTVPGGSLRPTRVLDVSGQNVRLCCRLEDGAYEYLVVSHMWGTDPSGQLRLTVSNKEDFERGLPLERLNASPTFKQAVDVTRRLGYRYLWIDSLCIVQDSPKDWNHEARRMALVYGNAVCNLAFLFPPNHPRTAQPRDPRKWSPCILRQPTASTPGVYIELAKHPPSEYSDDSAQRDWLVQRKWPLFHRAWTFQEYLLSPRTLLLGAQNLMWHCSQHFYDELLGPVATSKIGTEARARNGRDRGKARYFPDSWKGVMDAECLSNTRVLECVKDWWEMAAEYRTRRLTFGKDRVVAFAGIARAFAEFTGLTYRAGVWDELMPLSLLWRVDRKLEVLVRRENGLPDGGFPHEIWSAEVLEEVVQAAPSWSWFAVPVYRFFQVRFMFDDDELYVRAKSYRNPPLVYFDEIFWAEVDLPSSSDAENFFDFAGLQLTLTTLLLPARVNWAADLESQFAVIKASSPHPDDRDLRFEPLFEYYPDTPMGRLAPPRRAMYALLAEWQIVRKAGTRNIQRRLAGLMLVPGAESDTWKRVGTWKLRINVYNVEVTSANMKTVAKRWRKFGIMSSKWQTGTLVVV